MSAAKRQSKGADPARRWTDDEVVSVLTAEIILSAAKIGTPGFDSVRELVPNYEHGRAAYMDAARERLSTVARKRAALQREAARIESTPIDWKLLAARLAPAHPARRGVGRPRPKDTPA